MKKRIYVLSFIILCMCTVGCNKGNASNNVDNICESVDSSNISDEEVEYIKSLYDSKKKFTIDLVKDDKLLELLKNEISQSNVVIEIIGDEKPYTITYYYKDKIKDEEMQNIDIEMKVVSYILLALVGDLERVHWTYEDYMQQCYKFSVTYAECVDDIGEDVKQFSVSEEKLKLLMCLLTNGSGSYTEKVT